MSNTHRGQRDQEWRGEIKEGSINVIDEMRIPSLIWAAKPTDKGYRKWWQRPRNRWRTTGNRNALIIITGNSSLHYSRVVVHFTTPHHESAWARQPEFECHSVILWAYINLFDTPRTTLLECKQRRTDKGISLRSSCRVQNTFDNLHVTTQTAQYKFQQQQEQQQLNLHRPCHHHPRRTPSRV